MSPGVSAFHFGNPDASNTGNNDAGFNFNSGSSAPLVRSKPRLIKRKHLSSRSSKSSASLPTADSGFNLFKSAQESLDKLKDVTNGYAGGTITGNKSGEHSNSGFVFGVGSSSNDLNTNSMKINCEDKISNLKCTPVENLNNGIKCSNSNNVGYAFGHAAGNLNHEKEANTTVNREYGNFGVSGFAFDVRTGTRASNTEAKPGDSENDGEKPLPEDHQSSCNPKDFVFGACEYGISSGTPGGDGKRHETEFKTKFLDQSPRKNSTEMKSDRIQNLDSQSGNNEIHSGGNLGKKEFIGEMRFFFPVDVLRTKYEPGIACGQSTELASYSVRSYAAKRSDEVNGEDDEDHGGDSSSSCETVPEIKLSNELKKLDINNLDKAGHAREAPSTGAENHANDVSRLKSNRKDSDCLPVMSVKSPSEKDKVDVGPTDPNMQFGTEKKADNSSSVGSEYTSVNEMEQSKRSSRIGVCGRKNDDRPQIHSYTGLAPDPASFLSSSTNGGSSQGSSNGQYSHVIGNDQTKLNGNVGTSQFPPASPSSQPMSATDFIHAAKFKFGSSFATPSDRPGDFKSSHFDTFPSFCVDLSNGLDKKVCSGVKSRVKTGKKSKNIRRNSRIPIPAEQQTVQEPLPGKGISQEIPESSECSSPMDFSPYQETTVDDHHSEETLATSNKYPSIDINYPPTFESHPTSVPCGQRDGDLAPSSEDKHVPATAGSGVCVPSAGTKPRVVTSISGQESSRAQFQPFFIGGDAEKHLFTFGACHNPASHTRRQQKKYRTKTGRTCGAMPNAQGLSSTTLTNEMLGSNERFSTPENKENNKSKEDGSEESLQPLAAAEKACDKWRLRGNEAYKDGELSQAEGFYTWGINCIPSGYTSTFCVKPLVLCYSNRAATRMALGRVREGLQDCFAAIAVDPDFLKVRMRAASCHLMLGELDDAIQIFGKCLGSSTGVCLDRRIVIGASDGLQKAQKVVEQISRCVELLKYGTADAANDALGIISEAMSISLYSEKLFELKAEALCMLQKYNEAIELCQHTLGLAEKNFTSITFPDISKVDSSDCKINSNVKLWRWRVISRCYFHLGKFEAALNLLEKFESGSKTHEPTDPLAVSIRELLKHKNAGNEAFQSARHPEAVEHYTSALSRSFDSRPFAAVCLCNRAAAHQALGQIADAIADCSFAISLNENYVKAVSRRATLHEMIRDYRQATADLQRLVSLLEKQSNEKAKQSGSGNEKEIRQACRQLSSMETEAKKEIQLDFYLILGVKRSDTAAEIKKAYRKAALRHHPDKVGQTFIRSENGDDGRLWKDIADLVHKDSDRLFKMIGEAYAVLSDATKRSEYDHKEDLRNARKEREATRSGSRRQSDYDDYNSPYEGSSYRQYRQDSYGYRTYRNSYTRW